MYELRAGQQLLATLRWQRKTLAEAESADARWTFKREVFWHPQVTIRTAGSDENAARGQQAPGLGLLVVLGWYLILLYARDSAVASAISAGVVASS